MRHFRWALGSVPRLVQSVRAAFMKDRRDLLGGLLGTATVALNTDRRVTQKCVRRAAVLLGIDLSRREDATAERSHWQGGLAPWQARRLRSYIEEKLDSSLRAGDLAGLVRLSTSYFFRAFRRIVGINPTVWRRQLLRRSTFCENASRAAQHAAADSSSNGLNDPVVMAPVIQRALERGNEHVCEID